MVILPGCSGCKGSRASDIFISSKTGRSAGAEILGQRVGSFGLAGTFSFYANKIISTGEGGMVTTNDRKFADLVRRLCHHAFHPERHFWHEYVGFNYRMGNLQAAVGLAQTERFDEIVTARRRVRAWYDERLRSIPGLQIPAEAKDCKSVFWMYAVRTDSHLDAQAMNCERNSPSAGSRPDRFSCRCISSRSILINSAANVSPSPRLSANRGSICRPTRTLRNATQNGLSSRSRTFNGSKSDVFGSRQPNSKSNADDRPRICLAHHKINSHPPSLPSCCNRSIGGILTMAFWFEHSLHTRCHLGRAAHPNQRAYSTAM